MMSMRDEIARMTPERASRKREEFVAHLHLQREHLIQLKKRRDRVLKKMNEEIEKVEADIHNTESVIFEIDHAHFDTLDPDMDDSVYDECF